MTITKDDAAQMLAKLCNTHERFSLLRMYKTKMEVLTGQLFERQLLEAEAAFNTVREECLQALTRSPVVAKTQGSGGASSSSGSQKENLLLLLDTGEWFSCMEARDLGVPGEVTGIQAALRGLRAQHFPVAGAFCGDGVYRYRYQRAGETVEDVKEDARNYKAPVVTP